MDWATGRFRLAIAFGGLLLVASLMPLPQGGGGALPTLVGVAVDKWVHAGSYAVLTGLLVRGQRRCDLLAVGGAVIIAIAYGTGIEFAQLLVPTRRLSAADSLANAVGAVSAGLACVAADARSTR